MSTFHHCEQLASPGQPREGHSGSGLGLGACPELSDGLSQSRPWVLVDTHRSNPVTAGTDPVHRKAKSPAETQLQKQSTLTSED